MSGDRSVNCVWIVHMHTEVTHIETEGLNGVLTISSERFVDVPGEDVRISRGDYGDCCFSFPRPCPSCRVLSPASNNRQTIGY